MNAGETLGIVGESGSGKSMTALSILNLVPEPGKISGGQILFKNRDVVTMTSGELLEYRGGDVAMIFQDPMTSLNPVLRVGFQIEEAMRAHSRFDKRQAKARVIPLQERDHACLGLPLVESRVGAHRLLDLEADPKNRVQGGHRVLKDHGHVAAAVLEQVAGSHGDDVAVLEQDLAAGDPARFWDQVEDRERRHRFAAARLPDDPKRLAGVQLEADPIHGANGPGRVAELRG